MSAKSMVEEHKLAAEEHGKLLFIQEMSEWLKSQGPIISKHELLTYLIARANNEEI